MRVVLFCHVPPWEQGRPVKARVWFLIDHSGSRARHLQNGYPGPVTAHPGSGIAVDRLGQVYFLDTGSGLWKIDAQGRLIHLSTKLFHWLALDANDQFANAPLPSSAGTALDWEILTVGVKPTVLIASDFPIAMGQDGNLSNKAQSFQI